uniref:Uncharacterized protein n=1 Tax=Arundo donax TaxID=35708 RepID=A0A0A9GDU4_ARUDO
MTRVDTCVLLSDVNFASPKSATIASKLLSRRMLADLMSR